MRAAIALALAVVLCLGFAALWRFTPLAELVSPEKLQSVLEPIVKGPQGPFVGIGVFVVGGLFFFPLTLLILQSGLLFSPLVAILVSAAGSLLSALVSYFIGRAVGARSLAKLIGRQQMKAIANLDGRGVLAIAALRLAPVAPFTLVNLAAGAARVRLSAFLLGSLIGMMPGILGLTLVGQGLMSLVRRSSVEFVVVIAVGGLIATFVARALVRRHKNKKTPEAKAPPSSSASPRPAQVATTLTASGATSKAALAAG